MPSGKPTFDKINYLMISDACTEILKDLGYAVENYNTKFGREMLHNAIKKLQALKKAYDTKPGTITPIGEGGYIYTPPEEVARISDACNTSTPK
ncbi:MAG: hypothetical protein ABH833_00320 [Parcubacteria group bacterium]